MGMVGVAGILAVLLVLAAVFGGVVRAKRESYIRKIRGLQRERIALDGRLQDLRAETTLRRTRVETMRRELEALELKRQEEREERAAVHTPRRTAVDILKDMGALSDADVERARSYLEKTNSEQSLEEALVVLGIVSPENMNGAVRDASLQGGGNE